MKIADAIRRRSPETILKMARSKGARSFIDESGIRYETISGAARTLGVSAPNLNAVLKGRRKSTGGHTFRYIDAGPAHELYLL